MVYNRQAKSLKEYKESGQGGAKFLYETAIGRIPLRLLVSPLVSKVGGAYQKSFLSRPSIRPFMKKHSIELPEEDVKAFRSFNDFFTRPKEVVAQSEDPAALLSVADSKLLYYPITDDLKVKIKRSIYDLEDILEDKELADSYRGGTCLIFRLCVDDYHRYHFPDNGKVLSVKHIKGQLHTVRSISEKYRVYTRNAREVSILETDHLGKVVQVEVGALLVGKIRNRPLETFSRMEEKGHFEFGGSTVMLLINKPIRFDDDIAEMNSKDIETQVRVGEQIGVLC